jgi:hypothetical protein
MKLVLLKNMTNYQSILEPLDPMGKLLFKDFLDLITGSGIIPFLADSSLPLESRQPAVGLLSAQDTFYICDISDLLTMADADLSSY